MEDKLPFLAISTTFLILGVILVASPMIQDKKEITNEEATFNIVFRYGISGAKHPNELNTFNGTFTKDMVTEDPACTKLDLTQDEMNAIHRMMVEIDFFSYPNSFKPKIEGDRVGIKTPFTVYNLEYHDESGTKVVHWTDEYIVPGDPQYRNLKELAHLIISTIQAKPEYQKMPVPTAGYF